MRLRTITEANNMVQSLMKALLQIVHSGKHVDPILNYIASSQEEQRELLMSLPYVVQQTPREHLEHYLSSEQGFVTFVKQILRNYIERSPELEEKALQAQHQERWGAVKDVGTPGPDEVVHPAHTPSGKKLIEYAIGLAKRFGHPTEPYAKTVTNMIERNGQAKADQWAAKVGSLEDMLELLNGWRKRKLI